jgi:hypothetical protein
MLFARSMSADHRRSSSTADPALNFKERASFILSSSREAFGECSAPSPHNGSDNLIVIVMWSKF